MKKLLWSGIITLMFGFVLGVQGKESTEVTVTAYCKCDICCGNWAGGPTASGKMPVEGVTVAGPRRFKLGTKVFIPGVGNRVIQDRLAKKYDSRIDVFFNDHQAAKNFGIKRLVVTVDN